MKINQLGDGEVHALRDPENEETEVDGSCFPFG
jgi:hypothetical protein